MEKEFIPYEIALALKELGFDEPCLGYYRKDNPILKFGEGLELVTRNYRCNVMHYPLKNSRYVAGSSAPDGYYYLTTSPTFSQAFRWFREKYDLVIEPCVPFQRLYSTEEDHFEILEFGYRIYSFDQYRGGLRDKIEWDGYDNSNEEEAELECLKKLIEIVTNKN